MISEKVSCKKSRQTLRVDSMIKFPPKNVLSIHSRGRQQTEFHIGFRCWVFKYEGNRVVFFLSDEASQLGGAPNTMLKFS